MDLNPQEIITALPDTSLLKTALVSIGTNVDTMKPTEELFLFVNAYEEAQNNFNAGTVPETMSLVGGAIFGVPDFDNEGNLSRTVRRQIQFKQTYQVNDIDPIII